jgi:hypothetical protein
MLSQAIEDIKKLRTALKREGKRQIRSKEHRSYLKAVALAWFQTYRPAVARQADKADFSLVDSSYQAILSASEISSSAARIEGIAKELIAELVSLQSEVVASYSIPQTTDAAPPFLAIPDPIMRDILTRRWKECVSCISANAPLAATVMMGGLLEGLFLARINREQNKRSIFTATNSPKDTRTRATLPLKEWTLKDYIAVAHELSWISQSVRDVSQILRDYRNYIHPQKELSMQLALRIEDAQMFWMVCKAIVTQLS